jgi:hypothetical protein
MYICTFSFSFTFWNSHDFPLFGKFEMKFILEAKQRDFYIFKKKQRKNIRSDWACSTTHQHTGFHFQNHISHHYIFYFLPARWVYQLIPFCDLFLHVEERETVTPSYPPFPPEKKRSCLCTSRNHLHGSRSIPKRRDLPPCEVFIRKAQI